MAMPAVHPPSTTSLLGGKDLPATPPPPAFAPGGQFAAEQRAFDEREAPAWNPWDGPSNPAFFAGTGFDDDHPTGPLAPISIGIGRALSGLDIFGAGVARHALTGVDELTGETTPPPQGIEEYLAGVQRHALEGMKAITPDPSTTGTAARVLTGLAEMGTLAVAGGAVGGPLAGAALVGSVEARTAYEERVAAGVDPVTAAKLAGLTGVTSGAGVLLPGGIGSNLLTRLATGAAGNVGFGMAARYGDHAILESAGYHDMAAQQKVLDGAQMLVDMVLGTAFGGLAHLHAEAERAGVPKALNARPEAVDAALTANLALADRRQSPGVPVNPDAANLHQAATEKAISDLLSGEPVDVSGTGIERATYLERAPEVPTDVIAAVMDNLREHGLLEEARNLADLEMELAGRRAPAAERVEAVAPSLETRMATTHEELTRAVPQAGIGAGGLHEAFDRQPESVQELSVLAAHARRFDPEATEKILASTDALDAEADDMAQRVALKGIIHDGENEQRRAGAPQPASARQEPGAIDRGVAAEQAAGRPAERQPAAAAGSERAAERRPDPVAAALAERPNLEMPDRAADALRAADESVANTEREAPVAVDAAVGCYLRRGGA